MFHHNPNIGAGIDYGMGIKNIDTDTGIRFGVISANEVGEAWFDSSEPEYGPPTCGWCGTEFADVPETYPSATCPECGKESHVDDLTGDEPISHSYEGDGYSITQADGGDLFILKSPYFTLCKFCSPCAPGAGYLLEPTPYGIKTYCLGADWFEGGSAPYPVYNVETGGVVEPS